MILYIHIGHNRKNELLMLPESRRQNESDSGRSFGIGQHNLHIFVSGNGSVVQDRSQVGVAVQNHHGFVVGQRVNSKMGKKYIGF